MPFAQSMKSVFVGFSATQFGEVYSYSPIAGPRGPLDRVAQIADRKYCRPQARPFRLGFPRKMPVFPIARLLRSRPETRRSPEPPFRGLLGTCSQLRCSFSRIGRLQRRKEMIEFLTHMPADTVIFITMAVLSLVGMLIMLRRLI